MTNGVSIKYSPVNQAWLVMWCESVLHIFNTKGDALAYAASLQSTEG